MKNVIVYYFSFMFCLSLTDCFAQSLSSPAESHYILPTVFVECNIASLIYMNTTKQTVYVTVQITDRCGLNRKGKTLSYLKVSEKNDAYEIPPGDSRTFTLAVPGNDGNVTLFCSGERGEGCSYTICIH